MIRLATALTRTHTQSQIDLEIAMWDDAPDTDGGVQGTVCKLAPFS
jgi:hypothetical protein